MTALTPTVTGTVAAYSISPALPQGLTFNASTGAIAGTPSGERATSAYVVTATNAGGSATCTVQITISPAAPKNLSYAVASATVVLGAGLPVTGGTLMPTISGRVDTYAISPALPSGLSLNSTSGGIYGTATALLPATTYTITASNVTGSTSTTLSLRVVPVPAPSAPAPSQFAYPTTEIVGLPGESIASDLPAIPGTGTTVFSISPALPAGLTLSSSTGAITGTPASASPRQTYVVTAANSLGTMTTNLSIRVSAARTLLDLGHSDSISQVVVQGNRIVSVGGGHWVLRDLNSGDVIADGERDASGQASGGNSASPLEVHGQVFVIEVLNGWEVRSLADGHVLSTVSNAAIQAPYWWKVASDGSYICAGSGKGLYALSLTGDVLLSLAGNYPTAANAYTAPGELRYASAPDSPNTLQTISIRTGERTLSPSFAGQFSYWALDGQRFFTTSGIYSNTGAEQRLSQPPSRGAVGSWFWNWSIGLVSLYRTDGGDTPVVTYDVDPNGIPIPSGNTLGVVSSGSSTVTVIDLSGSTPVRVDHSIPLPEGRGFVAYSADSATRWYAGTDHGTILDGASSNSTPRFLGAGALTSVAGGASGFALSLAKGAIQHYDASLALRGSIDFSAGKLGMSNDGTVLAASHSGGDDTTLNLYSLPSAALVATFPYTSLTPRLIDFTLSGNGNVIGSVVHPASKNPLWVDLLVRDVMTGQIVWSQSTDQEGTHLFLSPDGSLRARQVSDVTQILNAVASVTAFPGYVVDWIDGNRILVKRYSTGSPRQYLGASIYNTAGVLVAQLSLPELYDIQPVPPADTTNLVYSRTANAVYSLTSGEAVWSASVTSPLWPSSHFLSRRTGAISGQNVIYCAHSKVLVESY